MNEQLQKIALKALSLGWSIIPCGRDKRPLIIWREFQSRRATEDEIKNWIIKYPEMNIAVITGEISDLVIIDQEFGADFSLIKDKTFKVRTQGGGVHSYFKFDPDFKNAVRILPLTDIRSTGGYALTIPSKTDKGEYTILDDCPIAKMSQATKELLLSGKKPVPIPSAQQPIPSQQVGDDVFNYQGAGVGSRNSEMTKFIGLVLSQTHPARWDSVAWPAIQKANLNNYPPLSDSELLASFNSIRNREISSAPDKWSKKSEEQLKKEDQVLHDDSLDLIHEVAETQNKELDVKIPIPTGFKTIDEVLKGGVRVGDVVTISGETGMGKSTLAVNISINMAERGEPVTLLTYEMFVAEMWEKMKEANVSDDIKIYTPRCHTSGRIEWVKSKIDEGKKYGIRVIVIDHLEFLTSGDKFAKNVSMNFSNKVSETMKDVKNLARNEGVCIILLCHLTKIQPGSRPVIGNLKDSASVGQESDSVLLVERIKTSNPSNDDDIYSPISIVSVQKSRRNGRSKYIEMVMVNGRFHETEKIVIDKKNTEAKEASGEPKEIEKEPDPIQGLIDFGFFSVGK